MTELDLQRKVRAAVKRRYPDAFVWKIHDMFTAGIPDLLIIIKGVHFFFELKGFKGETTRIQEYTIDSIKRAGGRACVARSVDDVIRTIDLCLITTR